MLHVSHRPHRPHRPRRSVAALTLAMSALPLVLLPTVALATTGPGPKAAIEHAERQAAGPTQPNKAQIEHHEAQLPPAPPSHDPQPQSGSTGDAALWQLAMSAGLGAALTGAVVVTSRRMSQHHHVATS